MSEILEVLQNSSCNFLELTQSDKSFDWKKNSKGLKLKSFLLRVFSIFNNNK